MSSVAVELQFVPDDTPDCALVSFTPKHPSGPFVCSEYWFVVTRLTVSMMSISPPAGQATAGLESVVQMLGQTYRTRLGEVKLVWMRAGKGHTEHP